MMSRGISVCCLILAMIFLISCNVTKPEISDSLPPEIIADTVDKSNLDNELGIEINADEYTGESFSEYMLALENAKAVAEDESSTEEMVADATETLKNARLCLNRRADNTKLCSLIEKAKLLDTSKYSETSLDDIRRVLAPAIDVANDSNAPQYRIDNYEVRLEYALDNIVAKPIMPTEVSKGHNYSLGLPQGMTESPISEELATELDKRIGHIGKSMSFIAYDFTTGFTISYNPYDRFFCASTVKAPEVLYIFSQLLDTGKASLDDEWKYLPLHKIGGAGSVQFSPFGTTFTLRDLSEKAISKSDNAAYLMLLHSYGIDGYNDYIKSLGCSIAGNVNKYDQYAYSCAADAALIWKEIFTYTKSGKYGTLFRDYLIKAVAPVIAHGVEENKLIAHKSGWSPAYYNDMAIFYGDRPYFIGIYSKRDHCPHMYLARIGGTLSKIMDEYAKQGFELATLDAPSDEILTPNTEKEIIESPAEQTESDPHVNEITTGQVEDSAVAEGEEIEADSTAIGQEQ